MSQTVSETADFILELLCEEIPARMQDAARLQLESLAKSWLFEYNVTYKELNVYVTPRRLSLTISGLPSSIPSKIVQKRGPRVGAPDKAIEGFVQGLGKSQEARKSQRIKAQDLQILKTPKGDFYIANLEYPSIHMYDQLSKLVYTIVNDFKWPKSMRWCSSNFRWVRPLRNILAVFDKELLEYSIYFPKGHDLVGLGFLEENKDNNPIGFSNKTVGHRVLSPKPITVTSIKSYLNGLDKAYVILDPDERKNVIKSYKTINNVTIDYPKKLLNEVAGLCEYPVPILGDIDQEFVDKLPEKLLILTMAHHQKYFPVYKNDKIAPHFLAVADMQAIDGNKAIKAGNERVLRARLHDALFLYQQDIKVPLSTFNQKLDKVVFHQKLGSVAARVERIRAITAKINPDAVEAAELCKADLVTGAVVEFPELQGYMGQCYAIAQDLSSDTAQAIGQHYLPTGNDSPLPEGSVAQAVALADKLEILVSFFAIDEKPTGSKDPYALRRAAYGILRILADGLYNTSIEELLGYTNTNRETQAEVSLFIRERCLQWLRDQGVQHDVIAAANLYNLKSCHPLVWLEKTKYFTALKTTHQGIEFVKAFKRVNNILELEIHKKRIEFPAHNDITDFLKQESLQPPDTGLLKQVKAHNNKEDLTKLAGPFNDYLDNVRVNDDVIEVRKQHLYTLKFIDNEISHHGHFDQLQMD